MIILAKLNYKEPTLNVFMAKVKLIYDTEMQNYSNNKM